KVQHVESRGAIMALTKDKTDRATGVPPKAPADPSRKHANPMRRIVLVGDSLAQGLGAPLAAIAQRVPCAFRAVGKPSTRVADWMRGGALRDALGAPPPALVLVCLGTNDMRTADPGSAGSAGGALIDRIAASGASVAWIGPPRLAFDDGSFRSALTPACRTR